MGGISGLTLAPLRLHAAPRARRVLVGHLEMGLSLSFLLANIDLIFFLKNMLMNLRQLLSNYG